MVAKISTGGSLAGALAYNINKVTEEKARVLSTNMVFCSASGEFKTSEVLKCFEVFMPKKYRTENPMFHVSLNPHPDDKLSDNDLMAIAEEYIEKMGYGEQPYIIFKHEDISRHHVHIVSTRVTEQGKKINDKFERRRSKEITRSLEQKYGLKTAEKSYKSQNSELKMVNVDEGNIKSQVENGVREVNKRYHFVTFTEYRAALSKLNISAEEVKGVRNGVVYCATDDNDKKVGTPIPSKSIGKFAGYEGLRQKYLASKEYMERNRLPVKLKHAIDKSFAGARTKEQLRYNLFQNGIGVVYRESAEGRLYGVTFIDHNTGATLNGSRLGKEYSANAIVDRLENPQKYEYLKFDHIPTTMEGIRLTENQRSTLASGKSLYLEGLKDAKTGITFNAYVRYSAEDDRIDFFQRNPDGEQPQQQRSSQSTETQQSSSHSTASELIGGGLGLLDLPTGNGDDYEEDAFRRRMQQQHKKKKGRRM